MTDDRAPHWWSWADIVRHAGRLGIPNFQRGAVWDAGNRTALLESIYEQSPCGSFVLWKPEGEGDPLRHGVPLYSFEIGVSPMWLVDGQQRTRAMVDTFQQLLVVPTLGSWSLVRETDLDGLSSIWNVMPQGSTEDDEETEGDDSSFWGVVLPAMRAFAQADDGYFGGYSQSRKVLRGSMFRRLSPRARIRFDSRGREKSVPPTAVGVVPLATLLAPASVFHDAGLRAFAEVALRTFGTPDPTLPQLDDLIPWGPQFVTGHSFERPATEGDPPLPMRWADLHERREDSSISTRVEQLAGLFSSEWHGVFDRFADMLDGNRFAVGWLPPSDVSAAIDAYVRINRSGIRVRSEERALALLSRAYPRLLDELADFARLRDKEPVADQRSLLTHESDRQLGFAVWMNTVTRYSTLALLGTSGRRWLGTAGIDKQTFGYRLDRVGPRETEAGTRTWARRYTTPGELIRECSVRATRALVLVDSVLSAELLLDHRMARPSTRALSPLIDLFYRLPASALEQLQNDRAFRSAIARLLRWALLAPYIDQPDLEQLLIDSHGIDEALDEDAPVPVWGPDSGAWQGQLRQALGRYQTSLATIWSRKRAGLAERNGWSPLVIEGLPSTLTLNELALDAFTVDVSEARSLQHPAVGWLYAIERRGGAREFLW